MRDIKKKDVIWKLFLSTLYISAFTFGGGYVIVTLMKNKFVDNYHWIDEKEMLDLIAIAQSAPGAIAVNGAIVIGYKLAGLLGAFIAVLATIIPPFFILSLVFLFYTAFRDLLWIGKLLEGMQAGVAAVIASVVYDMGRGIIGEHDIISYIIMAASFLAVCFLHVNVIYMIILCGLFGGIRTWFHRKRGLKS